MRKIEFRAKRIDNKEWLEGSLIVHPNGMVSIFNTKNVREFYIHPNTVGQFIGLTDKNGKKIFEGDIIQYYTILHTSIIRIVDSVVYRDGMFCLDKTNTPLARCNEKVTTDYLSYVINQDEFPMVHSNDDLNKWVVIGNVFDESALLERNE